MKIKDIMSKNVLTLKENHSLKSAAELFFEKQIDGVPIINKKGKMVGLLTKSHIINAYLNDTDQLEPVKNHMTKDIVTVKKNDSPDVTCSKPFGRWPVVDEKGNICGMLTKSDLVKGFYDYNKEIIEKLTKILESTRNAIVAVNSEGIIEIFNKAASEIIEIDKEIALGSPIENIVPHTGLPEILNTGKEEIAQKLKIGDKVVISNRNPLYKDDKIIGAVGIFQDISDLETISEELDYSQNLNRELDTIIEAISDGLYITDGKGYTTRINSTYEEISGIKSEEVIGKHMKELVDEGYYSESVTLHVLKERKAVTITHEIRTGVEVMVTGTPVFDDEGNIVRVVTTVRDMKKLSMMRKELAETKKLTARYYNELKKLRAQQFEAEDIIIESQKMEEIVDLAIRLGNFNSTVLITGESGSGKEIVGKIIHKATNLKENKGSFIKVNCGAIPENLLESELFGYEKGAFTGANKKGKPGLFELAEDGTLLLDEIGEMPIQLQVKLLRAIQEREIYRVGGTDPIKISTRIIAATNKELKKEVADGNFREDLFYRLNVVPIHVPSLRERKEEITPMVRHFLHKCNKKFSTNKKIAGSLLNFFKNYDWPGNVRELKNTIERLVVMVPHEVIDIDDLEPDLLNIEDQKKAFLESIISSTDFNINRAVAELEKKMLIKAKNKFDTTRAMAELLGISQPTVVRKMKKYNL